ncbi:MAG: aromatic ring-hydroxylating dioxygenase subunit alpha [Pseudomonadota bacterium]
MSTNPPHNRPGPSVQDVFAQDSRPTPNVLAFESPPQDLGSADISIERYFSQDWHDREMDQVWRKVWQMACREEELQKVGDHVVYNIGDESVIVTRSAPDEIRAYINSCLHRGTLLRAQSGHVSRFRCPYHGFTWALDGSLSHIPSEWDFEHVDQDKFCLPEIKVACWGGFVFVNFDPNSAPLSEYLEILPAHFEQFKLEDRWKAGHISKIMPCNWKLTLEAFIESFHIPAAHPQTQSYVAWDTTQYDVFPDSRHVNRMLTLEAYPSTGLDNVSTEQTISEMKRDVPFHGNTTITADDPQAIREQFADGARQKLSRSSNSDLSDLSNAEVLDVIQYFLFPNLMPWGGHGVPICYRFRPYENNPEKSIMEIMLLFAKDKDGNHPKPPPMVELGVDDKWQDAEAYLGSAAFVADQDTENLKRIQRGLRASHKKGVTLAAYQESRIRHFNKTLDEYLGESI